MALEDPYASQFSFLVTLTLTHLLQEPCPQTCQAVPNPHLTFPALALSVPFACKTLLPDINIASRLHLL